MVGEVQARREHIMPIVDAFPSTSVVDTAHSVPCLMGRLISFPLNRAQRHAVLSVHTVRTARNRQLMQL